MAYPSDRQKMSTNEHSNGESEKKEDIAPTPWGEGGDVDSLTVRREAKIEQRAVAKRWPFTQQTRMAIANRQAAIAIGAKDERRATAAANTCGILDRINQADEHHAYPVVQKHVHAHIDLSDDDLARIAAGHAPASSNGTAGEA